MGINIGFRSTMVAQLMNLAIPLLLQQIIDKVLNQGNVSTLNVLGSFIDNSSNVFRPFNGI